jgi:probable HAF family extracellular repeat protein
MHRSLLSAVLSLSVLLSALAAHAASYTFTTFDVPGVMGTAASGINNRGQIVGEFDDATGQHGFLKDGARYTTLDVPGATETVAFRINDGGQIVGAFQDAAGNHAFLKDGATFTTLDVPGARNTVTFGINDGGQIVGFFQDAMGAMDGFVATQGR